MSNCTMYHSYHIESKLQRMVLREFRHIYTHAKNLHHRPINNSRLQQYNQYHLVLYSFLSFDPQFQSRGDFLYYQQVIIHLHLLLIKYIIFYTLISYVSTQLNQFCTQLQHLPLRLFLNLLYFYLSFFIYLFISFSSICNGI